MKTTSLQITTTGFDYSKLDKDTASKLKYYAKNGHSLVRKSMIRFIAEFGEVLSEGRKLLANHGDGTFCKWANEEFDLGKQTIYNYVNAWDRCLSNGWTNFANVTPTALYLLTKDDISKSVCDKVLSIAARKDIVTKSDIENLLTMGGKGKSLSHHQNEEESVTRVTLSDDEEQARILSKLPKQEQKAALAEAVDLADGKTPTKEQLEAVVEMRIEEAPGEDADSERIPEEPSSRPPRNGKEKPADSLDPKAAARDQIGIWQEAVRKWLTSIDSCRELFPGPLGDRTIDAAKELFEALTAWKKGLK
jgi:hypothetical protein